MDTLTPARLAELRGVAEAATEPDYYVCDCYIQCGDEVCPNTKPIFKTHDNDTVLALIAALEAKTAEVERLTGQRDMLLERADSWRRRTSVAEAAIERVKTFFTENSGYYPGDSPRTEGYQQAKRDMKRLIRELETGADDER